jgi:hypothetical protein
VKATRTSCARPSQTAQLTPTRRSFLGALALAPVAAGASSSAAPEAPDQELAALLRASEAAVEAFPAVQAECDRLLAADPDAYPEFERTVYDPAVRAIVRSRRALAEAIQGRGARAAVIDGRLAVVAPDLEAGDGFDDELQVIAPAEVVGLSPGWPRAPRARPAPPAKPAPDPALARLADAFLDALDHYAEVDAADQALNADADSTGDAIERHHMKALVPARRAAEAAGDTLAHALDARGLCGLAHRGALLVPLIAQLDRELSASRMGELVAVRLGGIAGLGTATEGGAR